MGSLKVEQSYIQLHSTLRLNPPLHPWHQAQADHRLSHTGGYIAHTASLSVTVTCTYYKVLLRDFTRKKRKGGKMDLKWRRLYTITKCLGKGCMYWEQLTTQRWLCQEPTVAISNHTVLLPPAQPQQLRFAIYSWFTCTPYGISCWYYLCLCLQRSPTPSLDDLTLPLSSMDDPIPPLPPPLQLPSPDRLFYNMFALSDY